MHELFEKNQPVDFMLRGKVHFFLWTPQKGMYNMREVVGVYFFVSKGGVICLRDVL